MAGVSQPETVIKLYAENRRTDIFSREVLKATLGHSPARQEQRVTRSIFRTAHAYGLEALHKSRANNLQHDRLSKEAVGGLRSQKKHHPGHSN